MYGKDMYRYMGGSGGDEVLGGEGAGSKAGLLIGACSSFEGRPYNMYGPGLLVAESAPLLLFMLRSLWSSDMMELPMHMFSNMCVVSLTEDVRISTRPSCAACKL